MNSRPISSGSRFRSRTSFPTASKSGAGKPAPENLLAGDVRALSYEHTAPAEETLWFTPGDSGFQVWDIGLAKIGVMICFDWYYPESARTLALMGAEIICHPSNLVLPNSPDSMPVRCLENRVFAITSNRIGTEARGVEQPDE